jgi:transglutaminase-like putative cysteine protease
MARTIAVALALLLTSAGSVPATQQQAAPRALEFTYAVKVDDLPAAAATAYAWIPVPLSDDYQQLEGYSVAGDLPYELVSEPQYGNQFLRFDLGSAPPAADFSVTYHVRRWPQQAGSDSTATLDGSSRERYTMANAMVPLSGPPAAEAQQVAGAEPDPLQRARLLYDHIVTTVDYDKSGEGWGRGDALYACDVRAGNCTDFHSLFIGEARSLGLPARFTIGFPVPLAPAAGQIGGYHCWAEFWVDGRGWVPLDASEARKNPELREELFGQLPADRVAFTRGRDYELPGAQAGPVNFLIYPYVEVDGQPFTSVENSFSYREFSTE